MVIIPIILLHWKMKLPILRTPIHVTNQLLLKAFYLHLTSLRPLEGILLHLQRGLHHHLNQDSSQYSTRFFRVQASFDEFWLVSHSHPLSEFDRNY